MSTQEIRLDTIKDFAMLSPEQFERMLPDFVVWHAIHTFAKETIGAEATAFIWVDDGKAGNLLSLSLTDPATGEFHEWKQEDAA